MTAQFPDTLEFKGKSYVVAAIQGEGLFDPYSFGLHPIPSITACWRGYVCSYIIDQGQLKLGELSVSLEKSSEPVKIEINGISPSPPSQEVELFNTRFKQLGLAIPFSGGILAADGFIRELYVHMGFQPAWKYQEVFELIFEKGMLQYSADVSRSIKTVRDKITAANGGKMPQIDFSDLGLKMNYGF